jgi:hypothetical protein
MARELPELGKLLTPALKRARERVARRLSTGFRDDTLNRVLVGLFTESYLDGVEIAATLHGSRLGLTAAVVQRDLARSLAGALLPAVEFARDRALETIDEPLTVAQVIHRISSANEQTVWRGHDDEQSAIARLATAEWKTWVRAFARDEHRDHHDDLLGVTIPADGTFIIHGVPVKAPRDWDALPDPAEWMNCGHALDYKRTASAEDLESTARRLELVSGPRRVRETVNERRAAAGLEPIGRANPTPFRPSPRPD